MICHGCGKVMYYAPFGGRWCHWDLLTKCLVEWPRYVVMMVTHSS